MNGKIVKNKLGFTLVELSIYMGISMIILLILIELLAAIFNTKLTSQSTSSVSQDGRYIYTRLIYDVNRAQNVSIPANLGDTDNKLSLIINNQPLTYMLQEGNIVIEDAGNTYVLNGVNTTVSDLLFTRIGNPNGKHTFKITYKITSRIVERGAPESKVFQTTAGLR